MVQFDLTARQNPSKSRTWSVPITSGRGSIFVWPWSCPKTGFHFSGSWS